jgi:hypothetical protein
MSHQIMTPEGKNLKFEIWWDWGLRAPVLGAPRRRKAARPRSAAALAGAARALPTRARPRPPPLPTCRRDTAGQERYLSLAPLYYRGAHAAAIVYAVDSRDSFEKARYWVDQLQKNASGGIGARGGGGGGAGGVGGVAPGARSGSWHKL